jgi:hypothetical protein
MNEDRNIRAALDRHWAASDANDFEAEHEIYRDDAVLEYPQSRARPQAQRDRLVTTVASDFRTRKKCALLAVRLSYITRRGIVILRRWIPSTPSHLHRNIDQEP